MVVGLEVYFIFAGELKFGKIEIVSKITGKDLYYIRSGKTLYTVRTNNIFLQKP